MEQAAVDTDPPGGERPRDYDDEILFDLYFILEFLRAQSQDRLIKKARELGMVITPKDLRRGPDAVLGRVVRQVRKPQAWAALRDLVTWAHSGEIARVKAARHSRIVDQLMDEGCDWCRVYWLCLKAGKYHATLARRFGQPAATALDEVRERCGALLASAEGRREAGAAVRALSLREVRAENERLARRLRAAEGRVEQLKRELMEARQAVRTARRSAWEDVRREFEARAAADLQAAIQEYEGQMTGLREVIRHQDDELLELLANDRRARAAAPGNGAQARSESVLRGRTICVVGGDTRVPGYRTIVEAHGGRMVFASALEKLGRIEGAISGADAVVLVAAYASHKASDQVRQASERYGKPVALAHNAGLATFERVLVTDLATKLMAAAGRR